MADTWTRQQRLYFFARPAVAGIVASGPPSRADARLGPLSSADRIERIAALVRTWNDADALGQVLEQYIVDAQHEAEQLFSGRRRELTAVRQHQSEPRGVRNEPRGHYRSVQDTEHTINVDR